jgi:hypothetical protein
MSQLVDVFLENGIQQSVVVTADTTANMLLDSLSLAFHASAEGGSSQYILVLEGTDGSVAVLAGDVPVLSCPRRSAAGVDTDRLVARSRNVGAGPELMGQLQRVSLHLQDVAARQFRVTDNIRLAALLSPL